MVCTSVFLSRSRFTPYMSMEGGLSVMRDCQCSYTGRFLYLSSFFLISSGNTSFSHTFRHPILTKPGQSDQYLNHDSCKNDGGVRDHDGVTGVKKWKTPFTWKIWKHVQNKNWLCHLVDNSQSFQKSDLVIRPQLKGQRSKYAMFWKLKHQL